MNFKDDNREHYVYGINPVFETIRAERRTIERASVVSGKTGPRLRKLLGLLERAGIPVELTDKGRLFQLCGNHEHQGVVLHAGPYPYVPFDSPPNAARLLLLDNIEDPQNAGAILRSAEIFGWQDILMSARGTPGIYPSVVKASAGATEHLRITRDRSANEYCRQLAEAGFTIIALDADGREDFDAVRKAAAGKILLVVGGEHRSVGRFILNNASHIIGIPQYGKIRSLNASVAAGIALFELGKEIS